MHRSDLASQPDAAPAESTPQPADAEQPHQGSFLQTVMDAFPHSVIVLDRNFNVVMANRAARDFAPFGALNDGCLKCYRFAHHRDEPCDGTEEPCPLKQVVETKAPVRVYHTHRDAGGRRVYMAVDAAPIFDSNGEVDRVVESCRDVTERTLWRRILRIGNRHMDMQPLLDAFLDELKSYVQCEVIEIRLTDAMGGLRAAIHECPCHDEEGERPADCDDKVCICDQILAWRQEGKLQPTTRRGAIHITDMCEFLSAFRDVFATLSDDHGQQLCQKLRECGCQSLAVVPILFQGREIGSLHLADRQTNAIPSRVVDSLEEISLEMGGVLQRVRSEEELRLARDELEMRVARRTAQLTSINQALHEEILERTRLEREILQISAREQQRIGQELHDGVGQGLTGLSYMAQSLYRRLRDQRDPMTEKAEAIASGIPEILGQVRHVVKGLIPVDLTADSIHSALEMLAGSTTKQTGIDCVFEGNQRARVADDYCALQFYRITQEAVNNALRHAKPSRIVISLTEDDNTARITVRDDGIGIPADMRKSQGSGLRIMRHRARAVGGELQVRRIGDGGTLVVCTVPNAPSGRNGE